MPRAAAKSRDALLNREQVRALIHRDPLLVTDADDTHGFLADGVRWLGGRKFWLETAVGAFCRALPREKVAATSPRSLRRQSAKSSTADGAAA